MTPAAVLTGLYPPAVRERWGRELRHEVAASGVRCWPNAVTGAAWLWLHPGDWPETSTGQTRRVLTVMLFAIIAATGLLLRTVTPSDGLTADIGHPVTSLWLVPLVLGIVLAAPLPRLRSGELRRLVAVAARTLAAPIAAVLALLALAWSGVAAHATGFAGTAVVAYYWLTLGFLALRLLILIARVARTAALPGTRRLSTALMLIGTGLALAAGQSLLALAGAAVDPASVAQDLAMCVLAATAIGAGYDLRPTPA